MLAISPNQENKSRKLPKKVIRQLKLGTKTCMTVGYLPNDSPKTRTTLGTRSYNNQDSK